ncbi:MAG: hypothetical protein AAGA97_01225 [Pseudomonadota bacterium]
MTQDLKTVTDGAERLVHGVAVAMNAGSAFLTAGCSALHLATQELSVFIVVGLSALVGFMTFGALVLFTTAAVRILPRLSGSYQLMSAAMSVLALGCTLVVSGTSNGAFLGYWEAQALETKAAVEGGEETFAQAQSTLRQLEQIRPILSAGRETASELKRHEQTAGASGAGRGPIYLELLVQENRLAAADEGVRSVIESAEPKIRAGRKILEEMRAAQSNEELSRTDRRAAMENGLNRLSSIDIELREQIPLTSLSAVADLLTTRPTLTSYSADPARRQIQEDTVERLHREFHPIGLSLHEAVTALRDQLPGDVPSLERKSPTALVFSHAGELFWVLAVGYALDILPYIAIAMMLLARRQIAQAPRSPGRPPKAQS